MKAKKMEQVVVHSFLKRAALFAVAAVMLSACAKTGTNPYRHHNSAYSALPYSSQDEVQMLSTGELHYNY